MEESYINMAILPGYPKERNRKWHSVARRTLAMHWFVHVVALWGPLQVIHTRNQCTVINKVLIQTLHTLQYPQTQVQNQDTNRFRCYITSYSIGMHYSIPAQNLLQTCKKGVEKNSDICSNQEAETMPKSTPQKNSRNHLTSIFWSDKKFCVPAVTHHGGA